MMCGDLFVKSVRVTHSSCHVHYPNLQVSSAMAEIRMMQNILALTPGKNRNILDKDHKVLCKFIFIFHIKKMDLTDLVD